MHAAVTGRAWRTPLGATVDGAMARILAGERAARQNTRFPASSYPCRLAALIGGAAPRSPHGRFLRPIAQLAVTAGVEALVASSAPAGERLGLFVGNGGLRASWDDVMPALADQQLDGRDSWRRGFRKLHPFWMLRYLSNNAHALLAADVRALGEGATFGGACSGAQALASALRALEEEAVDAALVVAYDSLVEPEVIVELSARGALALRGASETTAAYDVDPDGAVPGEAAAAIVLERADRAGARAIAWVCACTGADGRSAEPDAATIARTVGRIAERDPIVDGASRGLRALDDEERQALAPLVGPGARLVSLSSAMGDAGAARPILQVIALAEVLARGALPPIAGIRAPAPGPLEPTTRVERTSARSALGITTGSPGMAGAVRVEVPPGD